MRTSILLAFITGMFFLAGCTGQAAVPTQFRWATISGGQLNHAQAGEEFYFMVPVDEQLYQPAPVPIQIKVSGTIESGSLHFELRQPDGQPAWKTDTFAGGPFAAETHYLPPRDRQGEYQLGIVYAAGTSARYDLSWHALKVGLGSLLPGVGMILVSLAYAVYGLRKGLGWRYFLLGALFWVMTVAVKFAFAIPVNPLVYRALGVSYTDLFSPGNLITYLYVGALTGVFEAGLAWFILRRHRLGRATWEQALAFGIGFGVIEALLLGLTSLGTTALGLLSPDALPIPALANIAQSSSPLFGLAPVVERLTVILAHIFSSVLIFYAIARGEARWGWAAILYKTLLDAPAAFAAFWGVGTPEKLWTIEAVVAVMGLIGLWGTVAIARRYPRGETPPQPAPQV